MIDSAAIADILALYKKHGWKLRRVLLCAEVRRDLQPSDAGLFETAEVRDSAFDALWFSRRSKPDSEAWELRRISSSPFALVVVIEDTAKEEREDILTATEERMLETPARETSH